MKSKQTLLQAVALLAFLSHPGFALAHARPKSMQPAADATVPAPTQISVVFTEPLEPRFSSLHLTNAGGVDQARSASTLDPSDPRHMTLALPPLTPGVYTVHWVTAALDGHRMQGTYSFRVK